jgi:hypothetical protein
MMMVPHAPQLLHTLVSKFDSYSADRHSNGALSQNSVWAAGKLVVAFIRLQLPLVGSGNVLPVILQHLLFMVSKYATQAIPAASRRLFGQTPSPPSTASPW